MTASPVMGIEEALATLSDRELADERMVYLLTNDNVEAYLTLANHGWRVDRSRPWVCLAPRRRRRWFRR